MSPDAAKYRGSPFLWPQRNTNIFSHRAHPDEIAETTSHGAGREHRELFFLNTDYADF
jgi:hypothetical protein